jgi:hypothetical protein
MLSSTDVWRADLNGINADYSLQVEELVETLLISIQREHRREVDELHADHSRHARHCIPRTLTRPCLLTMT